MITLSLGEIQKILPHRFPMLLVDRITELVPGERAVALKAVSGDGPWCRAGDGSGHAFPPSLLIESFAQSAAVMITAQWRDQHVNAAGVPVFGSMSGARFGPPVLPGDVVEHHVRVDRILGDSAIFGGTSLVRRTPVLTVDRMIVALRPGGSLSNPDRGQHDEQF